MPDPQPPHLQDAITRFRAAADAAVEQGRRAAGDARESGAEFDRQTQNLARRLRDGELKPAREHLTSADLRATARDFRQAAGLAVPELPTDADLFGSPQRDSAESPDPADPAGPIDAAGHPDDEDFSQQKIMRKL